MPVTVGSSTGFFKIYKNDYMVRVFPIKKNRRHNIATMLRVTLTVKHVEIIIVKSILNYCNTYRSVWIFLNLKSILLPSFQIVGRLIFLLQI